MRRGLIVLLLLLASCAPRPPYVPPPVVSTVIVGNPGIGAEPIECSQPPERLVARVETPARNRVRVEITGLNPGEQPILELRSIGARNLIIRVQNNDFVGEEGVYTFDEPVEPVDGAGTERWLVRVLHERGTLCYTLIR